MMKKLLLKEGKRKRRKEKLLKKMGLDLKVIYILFILLEADDRVSNELNEGNKRMAIKDQEIIMKEVTENSNIDFATKTVTSVSFGF